MKHERYVPLNIRGIKCATGLGNFFYKSSKVAAPIKTTIRYVKTQLCLPMILWWLGSEQRRETNTLAIHKVMKIINKY